MCLCAAIRPANKIVIRFVQPLRRWRSNSPSHANHVLHRERRYERLAVEREDKSGAGRFA